MSKEQSIEYIKRNWGSLWSSISMGCQRRVDILRRCSLDANKKDTITAIDRRLSLLVRELTYESKITTPLKPVKKISKVRGLFAFISCDKLRVLEALTEEDTKLLMEGEGKLGDLFDNLEEIGEMDPSIRQRLLYLVQKMKGYDFCWKRYFEENHDVRDACTQTDHLEMEYFARWHYSAYGKNEGRTYPRADILLEQEMADFCWERYFEENHDVKDACSAADSLKKKQFALRHYSVYGKKEERIYPKSDIFLEQEMAGFDWEGYLKKNLEVENACSAMDSREKKRFVLRQYSVYGKLEREMPDFSWEQYFEKNHDVRDACGATDSLGKKRFALRHYSVYGKKERRSFPVLQYEQNKKRKHVDMSAAAGTEERDESLSKSASSRSGLRSL